MQRNAGMRPRLLKKQKRVEGSGWVTGGMGGPDPPIFKKMVHEERGGKGLTKDAKACSCEILSYKFDFG